MAQRELEALTPAECLDLLRTTHVGRLLYTDAQGALAVPVNYALAGSDIIFRVEGGAKQAAMRQPVVGFEVDHIDDESKSGWSVIARGTGEEIDWADLPDVLRHIEGEAPLPWATGIHNVWLRVTPRELTGRRLGTEKSAPAY